MAEVIRRVDYFYTVTANKPGEAARILGALRASWVNLLAFTGFPNGRRAQVDFIPEDPAAFKVAAKKAGLRLKAKKGSFLIQGEDRVGALVQVMSRLGAAKINVTAIDAVSAGAGRYGAILWVKSQDANKAAKVLGVP